MEHLLAATKSRKKLRRPIYVREDCFRRLMKSEFPESFDLVENPVRSFGLIRTAIDRDLGSAAEGMLFETDTQHLSEKFDSLSVYIRSDHYLKEVLACFNALSLTGFGKKSSTGLGAFEIIDPPQDCDWLDDSTEATGFVSLSHYVPSQDDPSDGYWSTHVTYPKFHANSVSNVFKETILMLTPGSVFRTGSGLPRQWYGRMISVSRPEMPKALHYGLCFAVPLVWHSAELPQPRSSSSLPESTARVEP
jgi:CRISPR type III-A-associated RAMP protein Csm4